MNRVFLPILVAVFLVPSIFAHAQGEKPSIVIGTAAAHPDWPPAMPHEDPLYGFVSRPVLGLDADYQWFCYLCEGLPKRVEEGAEGDVWTLRFSLKGVWGDMQPLTAGDLAAGLEHLQSAATDASQKELLSRLRGIQAVPGSTTDVFITVQGSEDIAMLALAHLYPLHAIKAADTDKESTLAFDPAQVREKLAGPGAIAAGAMRKSPSDPRWYLGPYRRESTQAPNEWLLTPMEPSTLARLEIRFYQSPLPLKQRFLEGAIDVVLQQGLTRDLQRELLAEACSDCVVTQPGFLFEHVDLNLRNPAFIDRNVRHALALSVDRHALAKALGEKLLTVHNGAWIAVDNAQPQWFETDVVKAKEHLKIAGWELAADGKYYRDERTLTIPITYPEGDATRTLVAQELEKMWEQIGVEVTTHPTPPAEFYGELLAKTRFHGMALYGWKLQPFVVPVSPFHSSAIPLAQNDYTGQNVASWQKRSVDQAIETWNSAARHEFAAAASTFQTIYREDVPQIPLFLWNKIVFAQPHVKGIEFPSQLAASSLSAAQWTLQPLQKGSVNP